MNRFSMRCALSVVTSDKVPIMSEVDTAYRLGQKVMQTNHYNSVTFPVFVMVADIYRTFRVISQFGDTRVDEPQMRRLLAENDAPNKFTDDAIREVYLANDGKHLDL